jgi:primase-polymerase (primpol)-like protein
MTQIVDPRQRRVIMKKTLRLKLQERLAYKKHDNFKGITPSSLQVEPRWVGWCLEDNKIPTNPLTNRYAKTNQPETWGTYQQAQDWVTARRQENSQRTYGVGLVLGTRAGKVWYLGGVDLDTCRDPNTGVIEPWAQKIINRFASYTEVSPTGTGVKIYFLYNKKDIPTFKRLSNHSSSARS